MRSCTWVEVRTSSGVSSHLSLEVLFYCARQVSWLGSPSSTRQLHIEMLGPQGTHCHRGLHAFWGFELIPFNLHRKHFT